MSRERLLDIDVVTDRRFLVFSALKLTHSHHREAALSETSKKLGSPVESTFLVSFRKAN
jgi:hypothetical protein